MNSSLRLGVIVGERDPWRFFQDVYADLISRYRVDLFRVRHVRSPIFPERLNWRLLLHDLNSFMKCHDVVFFEWASELLVTASRLPKRCQIVVRVHRYEMFQWVSEIDWAVVDKVIFVSYAMQKRFVAQFPEHQHKTVVIPVGISTDQFRTNHAERSGRNIGTLCNISPRKRVYELILVFYELNQKKTGLHLHIGGGTEPVYADYNDAVQRLVRELGLQDKVTFYGEVTKPAEWYRPIDVFVSNSYSEGLQVALMEAMASGCYCVSHHWDGVEELLPNEYLFYTDSELQEKILSYLELSPALRAQHQERLRQIACEKIDYQVTQNQIRHLIEEAVK
jgi:glycosyltransferase involved in cell wall biosynthesis